jgi:hypothetical protein
VLIRVIRGQFLLFSDSRLFAQFAAAFALRNSPARAYIRNDVEPHAIVLLLLPPRQSGDGFRLFLNLSLTIAGPVWRWFSFAISPCGSPAR